MSLKEKLLAQARSAQKSPEKAVLDPQSAVQAHQSVISVGQTGVGQTAPSPSLGDRSADGSDRHARTKSSNVVKQEVFEVPVLVKPKRREIRPYEPKSSLNERTRAGKWAKGHSGNPNGPPLGLISYIRAMTGDGQEMVDHAIECLRGRVRVIVEEEVVDEEGVRTVEERERWLPADPKYQLEARQWLADRGYGKALQVIAEQKAPEQEVDYSALSTDEARELLRLLSKAEGVKALGDGSAPQEAELIEED